MKKLIAFLPIAVFAQKNVRSMLRLIDGTRDGAATYQEWIARCTGERGRILNLRILTIKLKFSKNTDAYHPKYVYP